MTRELLMYSRTSGCPFVTLAKRVLTEHEIAYREVFIDRDSDARARVEDWTGFQAVPTLVIVEAGQDMPYTMPEPLAAGHSPRGIDRGPMITEPNIDQLKDWLAHHHLISTD